MRGIGSQACQQAPAVLVVGPERYRALQVGDRGGALAVLPEGEPEVAMNVRLPPIVKLRFHEWLAIASVQ